jgi:hypothetical protein
LKIVCPMQLNGPGSILSPMELKTLHKERYD